jgi:hypothetical protein
MGGGVAHFSANCGDLPANDAGAGDRPATAPSRYRQPEPFAGQV